MNILRTLFSFILHLQLIFTLPSNNEFSVSSDKNITALPPKAPIHVNPNHNLLKDRWDVECHHITNPPLPDIPSRAACEIAGRELCADLTAQPPAAIPTGQWIWHEIPGCAAGIYLFQQPRIMGRLACLYMFERISHECAGQAGVNAGTNNVERLPDMEQDGEAISEAYTMFAVASRRLTH